MASYDFKRSEEAMLAFWNERRIYERAKARNNGKTPFYFLDGPPYTSGKVHLGTAWNKTLKDMVLRYKRMKGLDVWDRAGYDMHGLPTEHATMKELGLATKEEIENYGVERFITACKELCVRNMRLMDESFRRLGVWMDFENAYQSIDPRFIDGEWWLVKRAHEEKRLYEGLKTMTWCPECASALAKHECEYQEVREPSIFVKLALQGEENAYLIIWTTTPWTIPFNLAVMANPELPYVRCAVTTKEGRKERWILGAALAGPVIQNVADATYEVEEEFPGAELAGLKYRHPFHKWLLDYEEMRLEHPALHTVIMSGEYVDTGAGSGLVHCAPGCGPEDYEVGLANGLPPYNTLDENGRFPERMGCFAGRHAKKDDRFFIDALRDEGALITTVEVEHDYAHCWRCRSPVIFRATRQWFFKVEDFKQELVRQNDAISWVPRAAYNAFDSWLKNLRDNSVTKQRYWGTPLPVWRCDACDHYVVIGSRDELATHVGEAGMPADLHKPWIDAVAWSCTQAGCNGSMRRIPDILDVWVDAGTTSWNCLDYPHERRLFDKLFPADFILEGKDQIRGWFNLLHVASNLALGKPCFTNIYMHGFINDSQGRKMSKSLGNYILPDEVVEKYGANTFRYYAIGAAAPGLDMNYNFEDVELKHRNLTIFWNLHNLLLEVKSVQGVALKCVDEVTLGVEERYLLSRLNTVVRDVTERMESYRLNEVPSLIESLLLDMSRSYVRLVREKLSAGSEEEKETVLAVASHVYIKAMTLFAIVSPLFAEQVYQDLRGPFGLGEESIHLVAWPSWDGAMIDELLEQDFLALFDVIGAALAARDTAKLGVRWPSSEAVIETKDEATRDAVKRLDTLFRQQVNVKSVTLGTVEGATLQVEPNFRSLGKEFGQETGNAIAFIIKNAAKLAELLAQAHDGTIVVEGHTFRPDHFVVTRQLPSGWSHGAFPKGSVFLKTALTPALEAEGFARELIRRVQQLRKEAGLRKSDVVDLCIDASELASSVAAFRKDLLLRTGAKTIRLGPLGQLPHTAETRIRGKTVRLGLRML